MGVRWSFAVSKADHKVAGVENKHSGDLVKLGAYFAATDNQSRTQETDRTQWV